MVECLTGDRGAPGSSLTGVTVLWKTRPCLTERLLMGRKASNQTNKKILSGIPSVSNSYDPDQVRPSVRPDLAGFKLFTKVISRRH